MFELFSQQALKTTMFAQEEARKGGYHMVSTDHLLLGLLRDNAGMAFAALMSKGIDIQALRHLLSGVDPGRRPMMEIHFSEEVRRVFDLAEDEAKLLHHERVEPEHLLLGLIQLGEGQGVQWLEAQGLNLNHLRWHILRFCAERLPSFVPSPTLDKYGVDLSRQLESGQRALVLEWPPMIESIVQTMGLQKKHAALLVGERGVGKSSLIYGFTQYLLDSKIFPDFSHYRVVQLKIDDMIAEAPTDAELYEHTKNLIGELRQVHDVILVLENIHQLFLANKKEMEFVITQHLISLFEQHVPFCIATTTPHFYKQLLDLTPLPHYFQIIEVAEPPPDFCIEVLAHWQVGLEQHHRLSISPAARHQAVHQLLKQNPHPTMPESVLTLLDRSAAHRRWSHTMALMAAREQERRLRQLRAQRESLATQGETEKLEELQHQIQTAETQLREAYAHGAQQSQLQLKATDILNPS